MEVFDNFWRFIHCSVSYGTKYSKMDYKKITFFKGYLPQILLGPYLNTYLVTYSESECTCFAQSCDQSFF